MKIAVRAALIFALISGIAACSSSGAGFADVALTGSVAPAQFSGLADIDPVQRRPGLDRAVVAYEGPELPGTIIVKTSQRRLYLVLSEGQALRYPVGVGRAGKQWRGEAFVESKHVRPAWSPPEEIKRDNPALPDVIPSGAPNNPMGERVLMMQDEYAIHGTNRPDSVGTYASYGCIRMFNEDIIDLFNRVSVGTPVVVQP